MKVSAKKIAAMFIGLAFVAFQSNLSAQDRGMSAAKLKAEGSAIEDERVYPVDCDFIKTTQPAAHWENADHYYGYRVKELPGRIEKVENGDDVYYCGGNIWFRPYNANFIVSRPTP